LFVETVSALFVEDIFPATFAEAHKQGKLDVLAKILSIPKEHVECVVRNTLKFVDESTGSSNIEEDVRFMFLENIICSLQKCQTNDERDDAVNFANNTLLALTSTSIVDRLFVLDSVIDIGPIHRTQVFGELSRTITGSTSGHVLAGIAKSILNVSVSERSSVVTESLAVLSAFARISGAPVREDWIRHIIRKVSTLPIEHRSGIVSKFASEALAAHHDASAVHPVVVRLSLADIVSRLSAPIIKKDFCFCVWMSD
jgi:hypothetical protein